MKKQEDLIKSLFDYMIMVVELSSIQREKNESVKQQKYEVAANLRDKELELIKQIPSIEEIKALRAKLD